MSYANILNAVRARLEGNVGGYVPAPVGVAGGKESGGPRLSAPGTNRPAIEAEARARKPATVNGINVPLHEQDAEGVPYPSVYPSLTYRILSFSPSFGQAIYQSPSYAGDYAREDLTNSAEPVFFDGKSLGSFPRVTRTRPVEHPFDALVEVAAYAESQRFLMDLLSHVWRCFPPRGFLRVAKQAGGFSSWDMLWESDRVLTSSTAAAQGEDGKTREYRWIWTYRIEGYLDTSEQGTLEHLVDQSVVSLGAMP